MQFHFHRYHMLILFLILWKNTLSAGDCIAHCRVVYMQDNVVPISYNDCVCKLSISNIGFLFSHQESCQPSYRSLKFRQRDSGIILLQKAAVASCTGSNLKHYVDQSVFEYEEKNFQQNRNYHVLKHANSQDTSWTDGFRTYVMQKYWKPDGHLRFG